ncbi:hypothetical protein N597_04620 [Streptococcus ilei]|uniref:hypothetical protein n=1 Tax=Streptococcus TaxID=1301 RepID=UPI0003B92B71|nr:MULTISPECIES: hypothetical protein [Streptococcus]AGY38238.1 hypothetical protein N597_04620 [Streptococcus ilei]RJU50848.1 hypothetical protein DW738_02965 [Streptococcus sp. AM28-20]
MKNKFLLASVTFLSVVSLFACTSPKKESNKSSAPSSSTNVAKETTKSGSKVREEISDNDKSFAETKRIGSADQGYVNIPSDWVKYTNEEGGNNIQYSDKSVDNAIILNATTRERVGVAEEEDFNEVMAQRFENDLNKINKVVKSWRSTSKVGGNVAIQLNMILESGRYVTCWFFQIDGKLYYIACLGDEKTLAQLTSYVENTWSLDGTGAVTD